MYTGTGQVVELKLENGIRQARITCAANLIPSPGQFVLAGTASQPDPLPDALFSTESVLDGFITCAPIPESWAPGTVITVRGPLGHGFAFPASSQKVALVAFDDSPSRLKALMQISLKQGAAVVLVCDSGENELPDEVEVQPLSGLGDVIDWADYTAFDVARENLSKLKEMVGKTNQATVKGEAHVLIRTPIPCGGIADCGVCAVFLKSNWGFSCKDGPVFDWGEL